MRARREDGTVLVEFTWLAILLLVPLLYIVLAVFEVQRAAFAASTAARAAGRAFSQAPDEGLAHTRAAAAASSAFSDHGLTGSRRLLEVSCSPTPGDCLAPGSTVHVNIAYAVPLPILPDFLDGPPSVRVTAEHAVPYGTHREHR